jgi:hypothetical protein
MNKRLIWCLTIVGGLVLAAVGCALALPVYRLHRYQAYIESHYQAQLVLIEREMQAGKALASDTLQDLGAPREVLARIGAKMEAPEFFDASWSSDGHHVEYLKGMPTGFQYYGLVYSGHRYLGRSCYFGRACDGTKLIVLEGWLPRGCWRREYLIVFRRADLDSKMHPGRSSNRVGGGISPPASHTTGHAGPRPAVPGSPNG